MMTPEEIIEFRVAIIRKGTTMRKFCEACGLDSVRFAQQINGHYRLKEDTEQKMREFMEACRKETGNGN
jgi:hypothetical protein